MIIKNLKIFLQNIWKNRLLTDIILENNKNFILFYWTYKVYTSLIVNIIINKKIIQNKWQMIIKNSKKEEDFINELKNIIDNINTSNICDRELLEKLYKNM